MRRLSREQQLYCCANLSYRLDALPQVGTVCDLSLSPSKGNRCSPWYFGPALRQDHDHAGGAPGKYPGGAPGALPGAASRGGLPL
jgi:hypothetical protein